MASTTADTKKRLALAIHDFLGTSLKDGTISADDAESVEIAQQCIADVFHVDPTDEKAMKEALAGQSLLSIFGVYEKLKGRGTASTEGSSSAKEARPATPQTSGEGAASGSGTGATAPNPEAEAFKSQGNAAMQAKNYPQAIECYSKALNLAPLNPIYLSNRAAAYSASGKHAEASTDAEMAVAADPKYTKAWSRLGLARFALGDAKGSMEAYGKGIEYEGSGGSPAMKKGYETAKRKVEEEGNGEEADADVDAEETGARGGAGAGAGAGGMPDLSALAGMFGGGRGGGGGGMPDLGSIMNNPMFANMAQNIMSNPDMMNRLMNNPQLRSMAEQFGGGGGGTGAGGGEGEAGAGRGAGRGGGGMPDLAGLMNDPNIAEMARNLMGGGRGGGGAGGGAGGGRGA